MNAKEIIKLIDILIGGTEAVGDSAVDRTVEENLKKLIDITNWCLDGIANSATTRHRHEGSMRVIGERAFSTMCEYHEWLQEQIEAD